VKSDLQAAIEKLDMKINILDMQINAAPDKRKWPNRSDWKTLKIMAQKVVDEYWKEKEVNDWNTGT
jgi:hypothetical protein